MENQSIEKITYELMENVKGDPSRNLPDELVKLPRDVMVAGAIEICTRAPELVEIVMEKISQNIQKDIEIELCKFEKDIDKKAQILNDIWEKFEISKIAGQVDLKNPTTVEMFERVCKLIENEIEKSMASLPKVEQKKSLWERLFGKKH